MPRRQVSFLALPYAGAMQVAAGTDHKPEAAGQYLKSAVMQQASEFARNLVPLKKRIVDGIEDANAGIAEWSDEPVRPFPLIYLGLEQDTESTLAEEMDRYGTGTLIKLHTLQQDDLYQAPRKEWAIPFANGSKRCEELLSAKDCSQLYKKSKVVVAGEEMNRWGDDAYYFKLKPKRVTSWHPNREIVVYGRYISDSPEHSSNSEAVLSGEPKWVDNNHPDKLIQRGRVGIIPELFETSSDQLDADPRRVAHVIAENISMMLGDWNMMADDWTPCLWWRHDQLMATMLTTTNLTHVDDWEDEELSKGLHRLIESLRVAFKQQSDLMEVLDKYPSEKFLTRPEAQQMIASLKDMTSDWENTKE